MTGKIFRSVMLMTCCVLMVCIIIIMGFMYDYFNVFITRQLQQELNFAAVGVETSGINYLKTLDSGSNRITWIDSDGVVLYDTQTESSKMENHSTRTEVQQAILDGEGTSIRYSDTLLEKNVYYAKLLPDGTILRISVNTASMWLLAFGMVQPLGIVLVIVLLLSFFLARHLARRIVEPLNHLDLDHPLENKTYDELAPLLTRINRQSRQIDVQLRQLRQKKDEFAQITSCMNEGLVLLSSNCLILSMNPAANTLFHTEEQNVGKDFLTVERDREINNALQEALNDGHSEAVVYRGSREYQINISRIESDGAVVGLVLLSFDITEKSIAERTRREFTANVSHELKTPLTTIMASSEMIENGMVKNEDISRFAGKIHSEASRLLTLIEDIIRLSRLDEGVEYPCEIVDIGAAAEECAEQLADKAERYNVRINTECESYRLQAVPRLVHEIIYNLVENAIKYNVDGGNVSITVTKDGVLTVADSGIGIPQEHQSRVFERFYRVDKSHSKVIGGTGLGLSIVKHAAAYLGANVKLQSELGAGTTVTVAFCRKNDHGK